MYLTGLHLLFEYSTPFLHFRWYMIKFGVSTSYFAIVNDYIFVLAFFLARVCCGPYFIYLYIQSMLTNIWSNFNFVFITSISISNALNYYWFFLIMKSALVASPAEKKKKFSKSKKKKNNNSPRANKKKRN